MDLQSLFISNLRRIRKEKKITQETLAELCGTDTSYISQIEIKRRFPSISLIERIAESLGVEPYVLFKDNSEKPPQEESPADDAKKKCLNHPDTERTAPPAPGGPGAGAETMPVAPFSLYA